MQDRSFVAGERSVSAETDTQTFIDTTIKGHNVVLFMKGTPEAPKCGFSSLVVQVLDHLGAEYVGVDVLQDNDLRDGIKVYSDWPTIPQLYVKGEFIGGADIVREMFQSGELKTALTEQGVIEA
jgi:monothiol glutaredoxin